MENTLFQQGVELMLFGMGSVFVFLAVLIVVTSLMSALVQRFSPEVAPTVAVYNNGSAVEKPDQDEQLVAVITAAIHQYRSRHK